MRDTPDLPDCTATEIALLQRNLQLHLQQAARLIGADLTPTIDVARVADALKANIPALRAVVESYDALLARS